MKKINSSKANARNTIVKNQLLAQKKKENKAKQKEKQGIYTPIIL